MGELLLTMANEFRRTDAKSPAINTDGGGMAESARVVSLHQYSSPVRVDGGRFCVRASELVYDREQELLHGCCRAASSRRW
ncbi:unnamed protein product [Linum trigynum]|uniref:Uncharacterized protein n=1 Tax=Linum trigynum TaxID=586398 RepID=A0AAV2DD92_9ROSI